MVTSYSTIPNAREAREAQEAYARKRTGETAYLSAESDQETAAAVRAAYPDILQACGAGGAAEFVRANVTPEKIGNRVAALQADIAARLLNALKCADAGNAQEAEKLRAMMAAAAAHKLQPFRDLGTDARGAAHVDRETSARLRKEFGPQAE